MTVIEGIGDELVVTAFVLATLALFVVAWMSTFVSDPPEIADHVTPAGVVSQNLDFPGSIEDDLERIANEIEEEAEAVENEISVLTLQRTAFLQTLTNPGEARRGSLDGDDDGDDEDEEGDDDGDDDENEDEVDGAQAAATQRTGSETVTTPLQSEETIPTFEFPCPHEEAFPSSALPSQTSSASSSLERPKETDARAASVSNSVDEPSPPQSSSVSSFVSSTSSSPTSQVESRPTGDSLLSRVETSTTNASSPISSTTTTSSITSAIQRPTTSVGSTASTASESSEAALLRRRVDGRTSNGGGSDVETRPHGDSLSGGSSATPADGHMTVRIKFLNDVIREMRVKSTDTIRDFKATFFAEELAAFNRVRLIFNGQMLSDHLSFGHYNITNNTVIHCLISRGGGNGNGPNNGVNNEDAATAGGGRGGGDDVVIMQELDLSRLVFPLVAVILSCVWYFRVQYRQLFNATSSLALLFLTGVFFFFVFTSLRNRAAVNNGNNNNNDNNNSDERAAANNDAADNSNRSNSAPVAS